MQYGVSPAYQRKNISFEKHPLLILTKLPLPCYISTILSKKKCYISTKKSIIECLLFRIEIWSILFFGRQE